MIDNPEAYRNILLKQAYADENAMLLRKHIHDHYSIPHVDMPEWVLQRFAWQGGERVLDIGCGPGTYLGNLFERIPPDQYVGGDLSLGMLKALQNGIKITSIKIGVMDLEALPFADNSFDVVLASYVLHHAPNVDRALAEIKRVLRQPQGVLIAATNSEYTMPEFSTLMQRAVRLLRQSPTQEMGENKALGNFSLERGAVLLSRYFLSVARYDIPNMFIFRETKPIVDFIQSSRPFYEPQLPEGIAWEDFMTIMSDQVRRLVDHFEELAVNKLAGALIATDEGGFAHEYQTHFHNEHEKGL